MSPYDVEAKQERQTYFNDRIAANSSVSSFSSYHSLNALNQVPIFPGDTWLQEDVYETRSEPVIGEDMLAPSVFDFSHSQMMTTPPLIVEEGDQRLLNHFVENVAKLIFPILELNHRGTARSNVILPALETNKCYMHCCLGVSALHLKTTQGIQGEQIDNDIMRHRYATISELCEALSRDTDHHQILEATLGMIFFQCCVGRVEDALPDIPWHQHFQAVVSLVNKLNLPAELSQVTSLAQKQPPFNMTLTAWIDILGATMRGVPPQFADTYREKHLSSSPSGLVELMGCEDRVMYVISEIACLEGLKVHGQIDEMALCDHVQSLGFQIDLTEPIENSIAWPYSATGVINAQQLSKNMTAAFRLAARIYLCSLVTAFDRNQKNILDLVDRLVDVLEYIPHGPNGFDRAIVWPMLMGGYVAVQGSRFRTFFEARVTSLGEQGEFGSYGRMVKILRETWKLADGAVPNAHWRLVTEQNGWDFLLI
jgi:hypothetical protein